MGGWPLAVQSYVINSLVVGFLLERAVLSIATFHVPPYVTWRHTLQGYTCVNLLDVGFLPERVVLSITTYCYTSLRYLAGPLAGLHVCQLTSGPPEHLAGLAGSFKTYFLAGSCVAAFMLLTCRMLTFLLEGDSLSIPTLRVPGYMTSQGSLLDYACAR